MDMAQQANIKRWKTNEGEIVGNVSIKKHENFVSKKKKKREN
jgi:hypothetical protein